MVASGPSSNYDEADFNHGLLGDQNVADVVLPGLSIVPQPSNVIEFERLSEPSYEGLHFTKDIRIIDLRSRLPIPPDKMDEEYSVSTWTRYTLMHKLVPQLEFVDFEFATTGVDVHARSLTHPAEIRKITGSHFHGDRELDVTYQIRTDISDIEVNEEFLVINEASYFNAFSGETSEWASLSVSEVTEEIGMIVLLPEDKPIKTYQLYSYPHDSRARTEFRDPSVHFVSPNQQVLVWKVENPEVGLAYEIEWTW